MNEDEKYRLLLIGDIVELVSGGPPMTVIKISGEDGERVALCGYFGKHADGSWGGLNSLEFPAGALCYIPQEES